MRPAIVLLTCIAVGLLALAGSGVPAQDNVPSGELARGMITPQTQEAIETGLAHLAEQQRPDGSFGTNQHHGNVAITSLCGLAFMAGGHQPGRGRYGKVVTRALEYVVDREDPNIPGFLHNPRATLHGPMYSHGFATLFLAEAHGMVPNGPLRDKLRGVLDRAVKLIIRSQNAEGGWRYQPHPRDADISVTVCQIMALRAARNAGFSVPKSVADNCIEYVKNCQDRQSGGFSYQASRRGPPGFARTAAGVVALHNASVYDGEAVQKGLDYLLRNCKPGAVVRNQGPFAFGGGEMQVHYYYGHYYAVQAMWTAGGRYWREWYPAIRDELLRRNGDRQPDGSWDDHRLCRHYSTAMALIILQIPNNYLPIMQR